MKIRHLIKNLIEKYRLDCSGLVVLTEAASGPYLYNPIIPAMAGASKVVAYCKDSKYGLARDVFSELSVLSSNYGVEKIVSCSDKLCDSDISNADIVTNSGHLRPLTAGVIGKMKSTAAIPLMWESWELREWEVDVVAAKKFEILVLGTNERKFPCNMYQYSFLTALHLMMAQKTSIVDDRILIIGSQESLAYQIFEGFGHLRIACRREDVDSKWLADALNWATYLLVAEHADRRLLIGENGVISIADLDKTNISSIGVIAGVVDRVALEKNGYSIWPEVLAPVGYMSYSAANIGPYPVMDLFAAGIKVGQEIVRARLRGDSVTDAALWAISNSPAMDLMGDLSWT